jgi:murein DD-endopeptidase MepM/ murein hydrolase activator NlpD
VTGWNQDGAPSATIQVQRGDTVSGIAQRYGQSSKRIIEANHLVPPYRLEIGQTLMLPRAATSVAYAAAPAPPSHDRWHRPAPPVERAVADNRIDSSEVPPSEQRTRVVETAPPSPPAAVHLAAAGTAVATPRQDVPPPAQVGSHGFIWPVRGHVVEGYGTSRNGTQNDGINIAARVGAPVYAAAAGEVVYVGNELRGYGNLVLIKHENGYLTAYAHNSAILVHKGERVTRGQTIARVGATGEVGEPQLHFEIRVGRNPVDPSQYLPPVQQASLGE